MIKVDISKKDKKRLINYFNSTDRRVTSFFRGTSTHTARVMASEVNQMLHPGADPLSKEYSGEGARALRVSGAIIPKEEVGAHKKTTKLKEIHIAAVAMRSKIKKGAELKRMSGNIVIKFKPFTRNLDKVSRDTFIFVRYGPWTIDTVPFVPNNQEGALLYVSVEADEYERVKNKNDNDRSKIENEMKAIGKTLGNTKRVVDGIVAINDLEYYALRREFGHIVGEKPVWKPALNKIRKWGAKYIISTNKQLWRALFDPSYSGYGMLGRFTEISKEDVLIFQAFQDKVR